MKAVDITYFVYGTTPDNEQGKASGQADIGLSRLGIKQSHELKELIGDRKFDAVFCSDLKRAVNTARIVFGKAIQDKRLREIDYGDLTQTDKSKFEGRMADYVDSPYPNGESYRDVERRIKSFLEEVSEKYAGKHIAIVSHQAPQLALDVLLKGKSWEQAIREDWRKPSGWRPGWEYRLEEGKL
ncbi:MAG: histidine phosphatase family protein [Candidatus Aenigmatarchaeota archaeon]